MSNVISAQRSSSSLFFASLALPGESLAQNSPRSPSPSSPRVGSFDAPPPQRLHRSFWQSFFLPKEQHQRDVAAVAAYGSRLPKTALDFIQSTKDEVRGLGEAAGVCDGLAMLGTLTQAFDAISELREGRQQLIASQEHQRQHAVSIKSEEFSTNRGELSACDFRTDDKARRSDWTAQAKIAHSNLSHTNAQRRQQAISESLPARGLDATRYGLLSTTKNVLGFVKEFGHWAGPVAITVTGVFGVVVGAFQAVSGVLKARSAHRAIQRTDERLKKLENLGKTEKTYIPAGFTSLLSHLRSSYQQERRTAYNKRNRGIAEACAGVAVGVLGIALLCNPFTGPIFAGLTFAIIGVSLAYALYRTVEGAHQRRRNKREYDEQQTLKTAAQEPSSQALSGEQRTDLIDSNPYFAVREVVEQWCTRGNVAWCQRGGWLYRLLDDLGVPQKEIDSLHEMSRGAVDNDTDSFNKQHLAKHLEERVFKLLVPLSNYDA